MSRKDEQGQQFISGCVILMVLQYLGVVEGKTSVTTSLELVPVVPGLQRLLGIAVIDLLTSNRYDVPTKGAGGTQVTAEVLVIESQGGNG